jgi:hypothetical protein
LRVHFNQSGTRCHLLAQTDCHGRSVSHHEHGGRFAAARIDARHKNVGQRWRCNDLDLTEGAREQHRIWIMRGDWLHSVGRRRRRRCRQPQRPERHWGAGEYGTDEVNEESPQVEPHFGYSRVSRTKRRVEVIAN